MQDFPHHYAVSAKADVNSHVTLNSEGLDTLTSAAPAQFDGPGDHWSPESLLVAAVADCFVLSFKAIARASRFEWLNLTCEAEGTLDRIDRVTRFTGFTLQVKLGIPVNSKPEMAQKLLEKAESSCLVSNSLNAEVNLHFVIEQL